jgi:hypothetical protein
LRYEGNGRKRSCGAWRKGGRAREWQKKSKRYQGIEGEETEEREDGREG